MVYLAINFLLCAGIVAATCGLIVWLGSPSSVAVSGLLFLVVGALILLRGSDVYGMFGNASALIGAGMLIGGASLELIENHVDVAGTVMAAGGLIVVGTASLLLNAERNSAHFVTGAILLMGLAMHLAGVALLLDRASVSGAPIGAFYLYATLAIVSAGWLMDVRLVTALAIVPFAQALDTGTFLTQSVYVFRSPEPTLSIIQMAALISICIWVVANQNERTARHAQVLAIMAFIVANLCDLVGSLWGDWVGATIWGPKYPHPWSDSAFEEWRAARASFKETALFLSGEIYSLLSAAALAALIVWSAHKCQRGLFNASITFAGIHLYTQVFESFYDEPLAYVIGGIVAIPIAWIVWQLDHWIVKRRALKATSE
jgi:hypothetical protein